MVAQGDLSILTLQPRLRMEPSSPGRASQSRVRTWTQTPSPALTSCALGFLLGSSHSSAWPSVQMGFLMGPLDEGAVLWLHLGASVSRSLFLWMVRKRLCRGLPDRGHHLTFQVPPQGSAACSWEAMWADPLWSHLPGSLVPQMSTPFPGSAVVMVSQDWLLALGPVLMPLKGKRGVLTILPLWVQTSLLSCLPLAGTAWWVTSPCWELGWGGQSLACLWALPLR